MLLLRLHSLGILIAEFLRLTPAERVRGPAYSPKTGYRLVFEAPIKWFEKSEDHAFVTARHVGYPVSLAASPWGPDVQVPFGRARVSLAHLA